MIDKRLQIKSIPAYQVDSRGLEGRVREKIVSIR